jgi:uncharacterized protein YaiI (UPF0178 family)
MMTKLLNFFFPKRRIRAIYHIRREFAKLEFMNKKRELQERTDYPAPLTQYYSGAIIDTYQSFIRNYFIQQATPMCEVLA